MNLYQVIDRSFWLKKYPIQLYYIKRLKALFKYLCALRIFKKNLCLVIRFSVLFQGQYGYTIGANLQRDNHHLYNLGTQHVIPFDTHNIQTDFLGLEATTPTSENNSQASLHHNGNGGSAGQLLLGGADCASTRHQTQTTSVATSLHGRVHVNDRHMAQPGYDNPVDLSAANSRHDNKPNGHGGHDLNGHAAKSHHRGALYDHHGDYGQNGHGRHNGGMTSAVSVGIPEQGHGK